MQQEQNLIRGIQLFNSAEYYEAHEVLEDFWNTIIDDRKDFIQAIIQTAAAMHLLQEERYKGAYKVYLRFKKNISKYNNYYKQIYGISIQEFEEQIDYIFSPLSKVNKHLNSSSDKEIYQEIKNSIPEIKPQIILEKSQ